MTSWDELAALAVKRLDWTRAEAAEQRANDRRMSACAGKARHATEGDAHAQARALSAYVNIYECPHCAHWHIGKPRK